MANIVFKFEDLDFYQINGFQAMHLQQSGKPGAGLND